MRRSTASRCRLRRPSCLPPRVFAKSLETAPKAGAAQEIILLSDATTRYRLNLWGYRVTEKTSRRQALTLSGVRSRSQGPLSRNGWKGARYFWADTQGAAGEPDKFFAGFVRRRECHCLIRNRSSYS